MINRADFSKAIRDITGKTLNQIKGFVVYDGPSQLTGEPIVGVVTLNSSNIKTGNMAQLWILRSDINPVEAVNSKTDKAICGDCPHRGGTCYVNVGQAPNQVYKSFKRGLYPVLPLAELSLKLGVKRIDVLKAIFSSYDIRLGAYGDPMALPYDLVNTLVKFTRSHTGYGHQFSNKKLDKRWAKLLMVSSDSVKQAAKYQNMGARTFRIKTPDGKLLPNEIECLSDTQGLQCKDCLLCDGANKSKPNIAITVHGKAAKKYAKNNVILSDINRINLKVID